MHYVIYSKNDEVVYLSQSIISAGLLPKGRIHSVNSNNGFILTVSPIDFVEYVENHNNLGISKKVEIDDNPILVWFQSIKTDSFLLKLRYHRRVIVFINEYSMIF